MLLTSPSMMISTFSEYRTCARHVSRFAGQKDGRGRCASISSSVARFVRARAAIDSDAIDATLATQVLPKPGACAGNFTFAGREDDGDVKLHAATVAESITNWPEVVDKLRGTRFEKYLTMDGSVLP